MGAENLLYIVAWFCYRWGQNVLRKVTTEIIVNEVLQLADVTHTLVSVCCHLGS